MTADFPTAPLASGHKEAGGGAVEKSHPASHTKNLTLPPSPVVKPNVGTRYLPTLVNPPGAYDQWIASWNTGTDHLTLAVNAST